MHAAQDSVFHPGSVSALAHDCDLGVTLPDHVIDHGFCGARGHAAGVIAARICYRWYLKFELLCYFQEDASIAASVDAAEEVRLFRFQYFVLVFISCSVSTLYANI